MDYNDAFIADYERRVYGDEPMPALNKMLLKKKLEEEDRFWAKEAVRIDNARFHDDY